MESELPFLAVQAETGNNNALTPPLISVGHNLGYLVAFRTSSQRSVQVADGFA
jgi:hypothetical protein